MFISKLFQSFNHYKKKNFKNHYKICLSVSFHLFQNFQKIKHIISQRDEKLYNFLGDCDFRVL